VTDSDWIRHLLVLFYSFLLYYILNMNYFHVFIYLLIIISVIYNLFLFYEIIMNNLTPSKLKNTQSTYSNKLKEKHNASRIYLECLK